MPFTRPDRGERCAYQQQQHLKQYVHKCLEYKTQTSFLADVTNVVVVVWVAFGIWMRRRKNNNDCYIVSVQRYRPSKRFCSLSFSRGGQMCFENYILHRMQANPRISAVFSFYILYYTMWHSAGNSSKFTQWKYAVHSATPSFIYSERKRERDERCGGPKHVSGNVMTGKSVAWKLQMLVGYAQIQIYI